MNPGPFRPSDDPSAQRELRSDDRAKALAASELRYRRLFEAARDGVLILDAETGMVVDVNPYLIEMLGYSREVFLGKKVWELGFFKALIANEAIFAELKDKKYIRYEDMALEGFDGKRHEVEFVSNVYLVDHRKVIQCNIRDISARKRAAEEASRMATVVRDSNDAITIQDFEGRITAWNRGAELMYGYGEQEALQMNIERLTAPGKIEEQKDFVRRLLAGEAVTSLETQRLTKDGRLLDVWMTVTKLVDDAGKPIGIASTERDITERKRAEQALRESEALYESLVENVPQHIFRKDLAGRFTFGNGPFCQSLGKPLAEILGKTDQDFCPAPLATKYRQDDQRVVQTGQPFEGEEEHWQAEGKTVWVNVIKTPLRDAAGRVIGIQGIFWDITERKRAEEALRESLERFQLANRATFNAIWDWNLQTDALWWNKNFQTLFGYRAEEIEPGVESWTNRIHPEDLDRVTTGIHAAIDSGQDRWFDLYRFRHKEGRYAEVEDRGYIARDASGHPLRMIGAMQDVTERKRAEEALRESEDRYRSLVEESPDAIGIYQEEKLVFINSTGARQLGAKTKGELLGRKSEQIIHPDDRPHAMDRIRRRLAGETGVYPAEVRYMRLDGTIVPVEIAATPITFGGKPAVQFIARDITERKRAAEAQARLATAVEQAAEMIVITDPDGTIAYANPAFEKITGYTRKEAIGQNPRILKSGKQDAEFYRRMWAVLTAGQVWSGHLINKRKDGTLYEEDASISPVLDAAGKIVNYVAVKRDVTEQKKLEAQLLRTQRLESVGRLASGIAHDLNNILAPMLLVPAMLRGSLQDPGECKLLDIIESSAQRGAAIIKQLLTFGRGTEGLRVPVQLRHLVKDMVSIIAETFPKNIKVLRQTPADVWLVNGDPTQLHQVLLNLCVNARDAMPDGGTLTLTLENHELDESAAQMIAGARPGRYTCLSVTDTGQGIAPEILDKIYDPFFTTKEPGKGTGLGLSTAFAIAQSHGGFIQVQSQRGQGTQFEVYLPATETAGTEPVNQANQPLAQGRGELVLVVDDEEGVRRVMRKLLEGNGYRVIEAADGAEGMIQYLAHQQNVRVVLTDLAMPTMDGAAFIRALRRLDPQVRIITVSGLQSQSHLSAELGVPDEARLSKPFSGATLLQTLERVLHREKPGRGAEGKKE